MPKNTNAIQAIIGELAARDYQSQRKRIMNTKNRQLYLSAETREAHDIMLDYINGKISEEEYKAYCLRYNLRKYREETAQ